MRDLINQIRKTIVFFGEEKNGETNFYGTGFLIKVDNTLYICTAKHVIYDQKIKKFTDNNALAFVNAKGSWSAVTHSISEIKKTFNVNWIFHENEDVDVAIMPMGIDIEKADHKTIPLNFLVYPEKFYETCNVFFLSYQPGIIMTHKISPVFRSGIISLLNEDNTFYIDAAVFPGNSGSPVFLTPSAINYGEDNFSLGGDGLGGKFVGVVGAYVPYKEVAISSQTGRPRIIFEENTGLSLIWSSKFINEIIESQTFKEQHDRVRSESSSTSS